MISRLINHEPIPGYRLIERLGRGGYGEVWKAEAPGGLFKAIKFVYGDLEGAAEQGKPAEQELKALNRVKTIRHPYILSIERFDIVEGQLIIVMELADRNLWDRYTECRQQNLPGIPREELFGYLQETAEALDLMNLHHQIQHLDVKPQNLFLIHNHIKVADFGLAKDFEGIRATVTGGVTPVYAAPETFEGWISRFCDQYSLAIVYQELLTGVRPFNGTNTRQLLLQHISAEPDVSAMTDLADQAAVRRALSKKPDDRFPTCMEFVRALGGKTMLTITPTNSTNLPSGGSGPATMPARDFVPASMPSTPRPSTPLPPRPAQALRGLPALVTPSSAQGTISTPNRTGTTPAAPITLQRPMAAQTARHSQLGIAPPEQTGSGVLFPALVVGIGGTGLIALRRLRAGICERFGSCANVPNVRFLYIDTDSEAVQAALTDSGPDSLAPAEVIVTRVQRPGYYLKREGMPSTDSWLKGEVLYRIPRHPSTLGLRALGRLALVDYYQVLCQRIRTELEPFLTDEPLTAADRATSLGFRGNRPRVYLLTSLAGGTGSGMIIDLAYIIRHEMRQMGWTRPHVAGIFFLPAVERGTTRPQAIANAHAALHEIHHFSQPGTRYEVRFETREAPIIDTEAPFQRCAVLNLPRTGSTKEMQHVVDLAAGHLIQEILTPMGRVLDESRAAYRQSKPQSSVPVQTFGLFRMSWPRPRLLETAVHRFRLLLIKRWLSKDVLDQPEAISQWVDDQLRRRDVTPETLLTQLNEFGKSALGGDPETVFERTIEGPGGNMVDAASGPAGACAAMERLLRLIGKPGAEDMTLSGGTGAFVQEQAKAIATQVEQQLAEVAAHFIEQPGLRFRGAEYAIRHLTESIRKTLQSVEQECVDREKEVHAEFARFVPLIGSLESAGSIWSNRRGSAAEVQEVLRSYPQKRYQLILLRGLLAIYRILLNNAPEYLREVNYCRLQLEELGRKLAEDARNRLAKEATSDFAILPADCKSLGDAADQFVASLTPEELLEFEDQLQLQIRRQFRALVTVCLEMNEQYERFGTLLANEARTFLDLRLDKASPTEVFFHHRADPQASQRTILKAFDESAPEMQDARGPSDGEVFVLGAPFDPPGDRFRQLTREVLPDEDLVAAQAIDDIVFYREQRALTIPQLALAGPLAATITRSTTSLEHISSYSRSDVSWLPLQRD